jgi:hypothetical protein
MRFGNPELFVYIDFDIEGSGTGGGVPLSPSTMLRDRLRRCSGNTFDSAQATFGRRRGRFKLGRV